MLKRILCGTILTCALAAAPLAASAAPMFNDLPPGHWAQDAVNALAARGLLRGYAAGSFKGDRAMTRYEVAEVVEQLSALDEGIHRQQLAPKADADEVRRLVANLQAEYDSTAHRVDTLETETQQLQQRARAARW